MTWPAIDEINALAADWLMLAWAVVWQSTLLAGLIGVAALVFCRSRPAVRYWLWQIVAVKLLVMPFWTLAVAGPPFDLPVMTASWAGRDAGHDPSGNVKTTPSAEADRQFALSKTAADVGDDSARSRRRGSPAATPAAHPESRPWNWAVWLCVVWIVAILWQVTRLGWQGRQLRQFLTATRPGDAELRQWVEEAAARLHLQSVPRLLVSTESCTPFVCGLIRPCLVVPQRLPAWLDACRFQQVLVHELAHVKRRDLLWGWLPELARIVYFFHPVVYWVRSQVRLERELACDQWAMNLTGDDPALYVDTLVRVVSHSKRSDVPIWTADSADAGAAPAAALDLPGGTEFPCQGTMSRSSRLESVCSSRPKCESRPNL